MKVIHIIAFILLVVGGLNWGLVGLFNFNVVARIFGDATALTKIVYLLVGLAAVWELFTHWSSCKHCETKPAQPPM